LTIGAAALTVGFVLDIDHQRNFKGSSVGHDPSQCRPLRRLAGGGKAAGYEESGHMRRHAGRPQVTLAGF